MESLNNQIDSHDISNVQGTSQGGNLEESVKKTTLPAEDEKSAAVTQFGNRLYYAMAHHDKGLWELVLKKLRPLDEEGMTNDDFIEAVSYFTNDERFQTSYRKKQRGASEFMLKDFFQSLRENERFSYQNKVLPGMVRLILETEELFPDEKTLPILKQDINRRITLTKKQCACLLAHMALCITRDQENAKLAELINFSVIYGKAGLAKNVTRKIHKIKCIFTYFERFFNENPEGNVVFERSVLEGHRTENEWKECDETLTRAEILAEGAIETVPGLLQVVFSDKQLGDQVLQLPATQQQIMSLIHPELILSILFCEELQDEEAVRVYGAERYSNYKGYGDSFEFVGVYKEDVVIKREHVIMDAEKYHSKQAASQFAAKCMMRELNKAYTGFQLEDGDRRKVATGKWGCGVFRGNPQLKFMIQWLAASRAEREIVFYTYKDDRNFNIDDVKKILEHYEGKEVGELFKDLEKATLDMQSENDTDDENKNLFKVLIALKGL